jgi:bacterioferritin (cytochrome b1)
MSEQKKTEEKKSARRDLIGSGALAAAGALLAGFAAACSDDGDEKPINPDGGNPDAGLKNMDSGTDGAVGQDAAADASAPVDADVAVLNALLSAEYTAITAYMQGGGLIASATSADPLFPLKDLIIAIATNIVGQHTAHAASLVSAIHALGGTPVSQTAVAAKFTPPAGLLANPTITNLLKFATGAERQAAISYNNAVAGLEAAKHRYLATAIEGDESQHFIILAALVLGLAGPGANLNASTATKVPPKAFVRTVGSADGLDKLPNYIS